MLGWQYVYFPASILMFYLKISVQEGILKPENLLNTNLIILLIISIINYYFFIHIIIIISLIN